MVKPNSDEIPEGPIRRRLPAAERRAQILSCAVPLFARQGYRGTGTRELAAAAGVTEPVLYRHYENKAALFEAAVRASGERIKNALLARIEGHRSPEARLRALADDMPALLTELHLDLSILMHASLSENDSILTAGGQAAEDVGRALIVAFDAKALRDDITPETAAFALFQVGMGASVLRRMPIPTMDAPDYPQHVVDILLGGMTRTLTP